MYKRYKQYKLKGDIYRERRLYKLSILVSLSMPLSFTLVVARLLEYGLDRCHLLALVLSDVPAILMVRLPLEPHQDVASVLQKLGHDRQRLVDLGVERAAVQRIRIHLLLRHTDSAPARPLLLRVLAVAAEDPGTSLRSGTSGPQRGPRTTTARRGVTRSARKTSGAPSACPALRAPDAAESVHRAVLVQVLLLEGNAALCLVLVALVRVAAPSVGR